MAFDLTLLDKVPTDDATGSGTSLATSSITLASGKGYIMCVASIYNAGVVNTPTCSGWTQVATILSTSDHYRSTAFRKDGDASTSAHTVDFAGQTQDGIRVAVVECTDSATGSGLVAQFKTGGANTVTFDGNLASESNAILHFGCANTEWETAAPEAGFTELTDFYGEAVGGSVQYRIGSDSSPPTPTITMQYGASMATIGMEIAAGGGGPTVAPGALAFFLNNH